MPYKEPTCIETGLTEGKKCTICGKIVVAQEVIPITSCDSKVVLHKKDPTCTQTGLTQGKKCSVCGKTTVAQQTIDIIACKESSWIIDCEPTKTTDGSKHTECTMCGNTMRTQVLAAGSQSLNYTKQEDGTYYVANGVNHSDPEVVIPRLYNGVAVTGISYYTFLNNKNIESVTIPSSVTYIGHQAFWGCENLKNVYLPESGTIISSTAFKGCISLVSIDIPDGMTEIANATFYGCTALTTVTIPSSVTKIMPEAFGACTSLTCINFEGTVEQWNAIYFGSGWKHKVPATEVVCSNGTVPLN